jgi:hypothetical protein
MQPGGAANIDGSPTVSPRTADAAAIASVSGGTLCAPGAFELRDWPCVLDFEFDAFGRGIAVRPRVLPPGWHQAHHDIRWRCEQWTFYLKSAGGFAELSEALASTESREGQGVLGYGAQLESFYTDIIARAQDMIAEKLLGGRRS